MTWDGIEKRQGNMDILNRLTILETKFDERWESHDNGAIERQKLTCTKLDDIKLGLKDLQLKTELLNNNFIVQPQKCQKIYRAEMWKIIGLILGVPAAITALIVLGKTFTK